MRKKLEGWILDAYPENEGMRVWAVGRDGRHFSFVDDWRASFFVEGRPGLPGGIEGRPVERVELFSGETLRVLEVQAAPRKRDRLVKALSAAGLRLHSADMHIVQSYHYDRGHFPLALCEFEIDDGKLVRWELHDDPWRVDYELPPLKVLTIRMSGSEVAGRLDPNHAPRGRLIVGYEGRESELEGRLEDQLETLERRLKELDPDAVSTEWGDTFLLPQLEAAAKRARLKLSWSRDPNRHMAGRSERSFYTYGRAIYQGGARYFFGRWHLDGRNSFMIKQTDMAGLFEISRAAKIPVQRQARCTIGTALASMQMDWAWKHGVLIPIAKQQAEDFRPADELLIADKGGLCYEPDVGWHEQVAEYDFTSMYPEMMVRHNISPETVNCPCCPENKVPEIGHHLCKKRRGIVPEVLAPIVEKRGKYKVLYKQGGPDAAVYKARADAYKWALVCCFGYLGFKNARFGKIEAHECVTAWGREALLRAKESVESRGHRVLHLLVDSVWIKTAPGTDLEALRLAIENEAGCPMALDGVYKWLRFVPSRMDKLSGIPGRYFGCFEGGELKLRGIASRRRDTPPLIKNMQSELLERLSRANGLEECHALHAELRELVEDYRIRLREGGVKAEDLAITFNLSKDPADYKADTVQTLAAKQLMAGGVPLHAGETVRYVITSAKDKVKEWRSKPLEMLEGALEYDAERYIELLDRAAEEIIGGLEEKQRLLF